MNCKGESFRKRKRETYETLTKMAMDRPKAVLI